MSAAIAEALAAGLGDLPERPGRVLLRPVVHRHQRALGGQPHRGGLPDPGRRAGDQRNLALETPFHHCPLEDRDRVHAEPVPLGSQAL